MKSIKSFFSFSRGEQYGIIIFIVLIFAVLTVNVFIQEKPIKPIDKEELESWEQEVKNFQISQELLAAQNDSIKLARQQQRNFQYEPQYYSQFEKKPSVKKYPEPFLFNPNEISKKDFEKLGFSEKQAESIVKYREKGAVFKSKDDFQKVFVVSDEMFEHLEPWITLPNAEISETVEKEKVVEVPIIVELNSADTTTLKKIKGIGSVLAKKIVSYRDKLGGFYSINQLREINGIDDDRFSQIAPYCTVDVGRLKKLDLNKSGFKDFTQHPYFEYYIVKSLFEYKDKKGKFSSVEALREIPLIYDDLYNKISPYLYVSN